MMKLQESTLLQNMSQMVTNKESTWDLPPTLCLKVLETLITSMPELLKERLKVNKKSAVVIRDLSDVLILAGIAESHESDKEDVAGNYSYVLTTSEEDLKGIEDVIDITDPKFIEVAVHVADREHNMDFELESFTITLFRIAASAIISWLDVNAKDGEEVELTHPGYFVAKVGVEDGEKVMAIIPDEVIKQKVKGDDTKEK